MLKVGIIGRPNVGKSTLFNRMAEKRIAITDDMPGVTRDILEAPCTWEGKRFVIIDTPGFDLKDDIIKKEMHKQFFGALDEIDLVIFLLDGKEGLHPLDEIVYNMLREKGIKLIVVVNKIDSDEREINLSEFYRLGVDEMVSISASHGRNVDILLDKIVDFVIDDPFVDDGDRLKIVVVGRPNVGKSSLINAWLNEERVIVTDIPGTTRDSVDSYFEWGGEKYLLIDTAGIRKKSVMFKDKIEKYGYYRAYDSIERADVAVAVLDATQGITEKDVKVIADVYDMGKPAVIAINKWDLIEDKKNAQKNLLLDLEEKLKFIYKPSVIFISAKDRKNVFKIFAAAKKLDEEMSKRITTGKLNEVLEEAQARHQAPMIKNRRLKFYYMTQVAVKPPEFVVFVNYPEAVHFSYQRFLFNMVREHFGFEGIPMKMHFRKRGKNEDE
ncbi:MAG: ribosome biogenesis GTPase Der [Calditerrivibrio sp.]|nr:ribosome biogenesis GTPase Der [Calditerrivibrio sp.]MCA1932189.1 ribosome biogenesis GTPase Der [Calditerrivibrio sp.]MCA1980941.1 ribosome biogenesis GTPase Der [Calditerrivibrio sp.]